MNFTKIKINLNYKFINLIDENNSKQGGYIVILF